MRDDLLTYYERELTYLRRMSGEFAAKYPKIAQRLQLEPGRCEDPHVERLIEAFAFLSARIHLKIDDEFPEITESLLQILYPHYLSPFPSMSVVQFVIDPEQGKLSSGYSVPAGSQLYSKPSQETVCQFRTAYPVTLWPLRIVSTHLEVPAPPGPQAKPSACGLRLDLETEGDCALEELEIESLRFYLCGTGQFVYRLYEALFCSCTQVEVGPPGKESSSSPIQLGKGALRAVGFEAGEGMIPYSSRSFIGYRLLQEYFHFPEKFLFLEVRGLECLREAGFEKGFGLTFHLDQVPALDQEVEPDHFRLGCSPVVNLFEQTAEPIRLDQAHAEYRVIPDVRRQNSMEVFSIDSVTSVSPHTGTTVEYQPFYSFKHSFTGEDVHTFWHAARRPSERKDDKGSEVYLTLVDLNFNPHLPATDSIIVRTQCTNRDLPGMLPFGDPEGDMELAGGGPIKAIHCLTKPSPAQRPPLRHGAQWRLISHLSLNYLSLVDGGADGNPEALQEILSLYNFSESPSVRQHISGLVSVRSRQVLRRISSTFGTGFARGIEASLEFDESHFVGSGVFLFAAVLERFLGLYVSINSFSQMIAKTRQRGTIREWPPRAGLQILL